MVKSKYVTQRAAAKIATNEMRNGVYFLLFVPILFALVGGIAAQMIYFIACFICGGCSGSGNRDLVTYGAAAIGGLAGLVYWSSVKTFSKGDL